MSKAPGSIDVKLVVDTTEAKAQIAALREEAQAALAPEALAGYRLRALELAIGSIDNRNLLTTKDFLARAAQFAGFITGNGASHE